MIYLVFIILGIFVLIYLIIGFFISLFLYNDLISDKKSWIITPAIITLWFPAVLFLMAWYLTEYLINCYKLRYRQKN